MENIYEYILRLEHERNLFIIELNNKTQIINELLEKINRLEQIDESKMSNDLLSESNEEVFSKVKLTVNVKSLQERRKEKNVSRRMSKLIDNILNDDLTPPSSNKCITLCGSPLYFGHSNIW